jgi:hypothetical protein
MNNPTRQKLAYRCRLLSQLAGVLAPTAESAAIRKAFRLFADELLDMSIEINQPDPEEPEGFGILTNISPLSETTTVSGRSVGNRLSGE